MSVNDIYTLPPKVRKMAEMADLLQAEQSELDLLQFTIDTMGKELNINSGQHLLPRYEEQFALPYIPSLSIEERRAKILAKLNTRGSTTIEALRELVRTITGCDSEIKEHFGEYSFSVIVYLLYPDATKDLQEVIAQIEEVKPAHLSFDTIADIEPLKFENKNNLAVKHLKMLFRHNNFGVESVYLDGRKSLDGSWQLSQSYTKGISFHRLKIPMKVKNQLQTSHHSLMKATIQNYQVVKHISTKIAVKASESELISEQAFTTGVVLKNAQAVHWAVIENTMYALDGSVLLDGQRKLNADIKRSEL